MKKVLSSTQTPAATQGPRGQVLPESSFRRASGRSRHQRAGWGGSALRTLRAWQRWAPAWREWPSGGGRGRGGAEQLAFSAMRTLHSYGRPVLRKDQQYFHDDWTTRTGESLCWPRGYRLGRGATGDKCVARRAPTAWAPALVRLVTVVHGAAARPGEYSLQALHA